MTDKRKPKTRAMELLTERGWLACDVERKITRTVSKDLFGFADILAIDSEITGRTLAVQVTSYNNTADRLNKLLAEPNVIKCLKCGWLVEVWGLPTNEERHGKKILCRSLTWIDSNLRVANCSLVLDD